jgi:hypothetical protein
VACCGLHVASVVAAVVVVIVTVLLVVNEPACGCRSVFFLEHFLHFLSVAVGGEERGQVSRVSRPEWLSNMTASAHFSHHLIIKIKARHCPWLYPRSLSCLPTVSSSSLPSAPSSPPLLRLSSLSPVSSPDSSHGPGRCYRPGPARPSHKVKGIPDNNRRRSRSVFLLSTSSARLSHRRSCCAWHVDDLKYESKYKELRKKVKIVEEVRIYSCAPLRHSLY